MKSRVTLALGLSAQLILYAPSAEAGVKHRVRECLSRTYKAVVLDMLNEDRSGSSFEVAYRAEDGNLVPHVPVALGRRLGSGYVGSVYVLESKSPELRAGFDGPVVLKIGNSPHLFRRADPIPVPIVINAKIRAEYAEFELLRQSAPQIEKDIHYPMSPAWDTESHRLPFLPILRRAWLPDGSTVLTKPMVKGLELSDLARQYPKGLTREMKSSLEEIYLLAQAIANHVQTRDGRPFMLDIKAPNLIWVEDPVELKRLGLKRPSFFMFEATHVTTADYRLHRYPFKDYLEGFERYIKAQAAH